MNPESSRKPRPYWHVDAKWVTGIVLLVILTITFVNLFLVQLTGPKQGVELITVLLASTFSASGGGLDDPGDIEIMRKEIANAPDGEWQPIPGLEIVVRAEDIEGMTPREARLWFFRQWAEPLYYEGAEGLAAKMSDPEMRMAMEEGIGPLAVISQQTHRQLRSILFVSLLLSVVLLGGVVYFSRRHGRLSSPGCVIFLAAFPGFLGAVVLSGLLSQGELASIDSGEPGMTTRLLMLAGDVLPAILERVVLQYVILLAIGVLLMLAALVWALFFRGDEEMDEWEDEEDFGETEGL